MICSNRELKDHCLSKALEDRCLDSCTCLSCLVDLRQQIPLPSVSILCVTLQCSHVHLLIDALI